MERNGRAADGGGNGPRLDRRSFLTGATATATVLGGTAAYGQAGQPPTRYAKDAPPVRYPDPDMISLDKRFDKYRLGNTAIQRLYTGTQWAEGPAWNAVGKYLLWSDIPNDVQMRWLWDDGRVTTFRNPAGNSNGNTFDFEGRQIACEHGNRRVVRYEHDGSVTVLAAQWQGKPYNAPNDVVVHPDGGIWFTDPGYGSMMNYEGNKGELYHKEAVYRIDPKTLQVAKVTDEIAKPNGLCFSPDYKKLYVADTGGTNAVWAWEVADNKLRNGKPFASMKLNLKGRGEVAGNADGIRTDTDGNLWASAGWVGDGYDGVHVFAPDATRIGQILLPEICSNLCFGGPKRNRLFMTASQSLYAVYVEARGSHVT